MKSVALLQGIYFLVTGVWPIFSIGTFMAVTGPKRDIWLVKTVGVVIAAIGAALVVAGAMDEIGVSIAVLAISSAAGLAAVDVVYATKGVISKVYLLDAVAEAVLIVWWAVVLALR